MLEQGRFGPSVHLYSLFPYPAALSSPVAPSHGAEQKVPIDG